ncbi:MAG: hypothetical protein ACO1PN_00990 [Betaproteobacteria bacterium]
MAEKLFYRQDAKSFLPPRRQERQEKQNRNKTLGTSIFCISFKGSLGVLGDLAVNGVQALYFLR